jgi:hypothetical protein
MSFNQDLAIGESVEEQFLSVIRKKYPSAVKIPKKFSEYDIFVPEKDLKIEIKSDQKSNYTGNIVIEIEMFGKPSGLMATKADMWVFYDGKDFMSITPKDITYFLFINRLVHTEFVGKGDTEKKKAFLVPKDKFFSVCKRVSA